MQGTPTKQPAQGQGRTPPLPPPPHLPQPSSLFSVPMFSVPGQVGNEEPSRSQMGGVVSVGRARILSKILKMPRATGGGGWDRQLNRAPGQLSLSPNPMPTQSVKWAVTLV